MKKINELTSADHMKGGNKMFFAAYRINGKEYAGVYTRYQDYIRDTFSPDTEIIGLIELVTRRTLSPYGRI